MYSFINVLCGFFLNNVLFLSYFWQAYRSLELLLSKPLNSSVPVLNINVNVTATDTDTYNDTFNVPTSLSYLLITRYDTFSINFTDPNGKFMTVDLL